MEINLEQKLTFVYIAFGLSMGFLSKFLDGLTTIPNTATFLLAFLVPILLYIASFFVLRKMFKEKKPGWLMQNSVVTYAFIWQVSWIVLHNTVVI